VVVYGIEDYIVNAQFFSDRCFRNDEELGSARPLPNSKLSHKIRYSSGACAVFIPLELDGKPIGVRFFWRPIADITRRYQAIKERLDEIDCPHIIRFEFREGPNDGAIIDQDAVPFVKLEVVDGKTLRKHVRGLVQDRDRHGLLQLAERWARVARDLESQGVAHGDLHATNIMVENETGKIKLIDLDSFFVKGLEGLQLPAFGAPAFQHPQHKEEFFNERTDRFPALVIYVTLRVLAEKPELFSGGDEGTNLLFTAEDLCPDSRSDLLETLQNELSEDVGQLLHELARAAGGPEEDVPSLSTLVDVPPDSKELEAAWARFQAAMASGDEEQIMESWDDETLRADPRGASHREFVESLMTEADALRQIQTVVEERDDPGFMQLWQVIGACEKAQHLVEDAKECRRRLRAFASAQRAADDLEDQELIDEFAVIEGMPYAEHLRREVKAAKRRIQAFEDALELLREGSGDKAVEIWDRAGLAQAPYARLLQRSIEVARHESRDV